MSPSKKTVFLYLSLLSAIGIFSIGCTPSGSNGRQDTRQTSPSVDVEAPNTKVDIGDDGIKVDAPGVDVKVGGGDGVQVDAPGAHVDLGGNK